MNNQGFTYVEALITLMIAAIVLLLISNLMIAIKWPEAKVEVRTQSIISAIQEELLEVEKMECQEQELVMRTFNDEEIKYELAANNLIRTVNQKGHEIVAYKIDNLSFRQKKNICYVEYENRKGKYEKVIGSIIN